MTPQEQRTADTLIDRIRQRRDTIDPELAQRIHQGLRDVPDAFYLLAQAAIAQGIQLESRQSASPVQAAPLLPPPPPAVWQQSPQAQQPQGGFLDRVLGPSQPVGAQPYYGGSPSGYPAPSQAAPTVPPPSTVQPTGQPLGSAGYQAVNSNLPGANLNSAPQYAPPGYGYGNPSSAPAAYPQPGYPQPGYGAQGYPQPGYGQPSYPQPGYQQPGYPQAAYPQGAYPQPGYSPSGYPGQGGGGMLSGMGGVLAGAAAGGLAVAGIESVVHSYENHERREEERAHGDSEYRPEHEHRMADTGSERDDSGFYNPDHDASRRDDTSGGAAQFADTSSDDSSSNFDSFSDDSSSDFDSSSDS